MQVPIEQIIVKLIQTYMGLPDNYGTDANRNIIPCVSIASQNIKLFNTPNLQVTVKTISNNLYSNRKEYFDVTETVNDVVKTKLCERINLNEQRVMQIDAYSRNNLLRYLHIMRRHTCALLFQGGHVTNSFVMCSSHNLSDRPISILKSRNIYICLINNASQIYIPYIANIMRCVLWQWEW